MRPASHGLPTESLREHACASARWRSGGDGSVQPNTPASDGAHEVVVLNTAFCSGMHVCSHCHVYNCVLHSVGFEGLISKQPAACAVCAYVNKHSCR